MNRILKAVIVDDEELARIGLRLLLEKFQSITVTGEASDIRSAAELIDELKPDIVFLDIEFPGESGFDLLDKIEETINIVFTTAFDEFALRAFEVNACDYLLKPVNIKRLEQTIERIIKKSDRTAPEVTFKYDDKIFLPINYRHYFIKINSIVRICSAGKYSEILTLNNTKGLVKKSLNEWEKCLPGNEFVRIHRSTIINTDLIEKIHKDSRSLFTVTLKGTSERYAVSRRMTSRIKKEFGLESR